MPSLPKISVVIPLYNNEDTIDRALRSVLAQEFQGLYEIIVVDDGSTDTSPVQVTNFNNSEIKLVRQKNAGVSAARNRGVSEAKAEYVAFLDADDEWKPNFLSLIWQLIHDFPNAGVYASGYFLKYPDGKMIKADIKTKFPNSHAGLLENYFACAVSGNGPLWTSAVCVPKKIFIELDGFPENTHMQEDLQMWVKIALQYPIVFLPQPASIYYKDSVNSACKLRVPKREDMIFADTINKAIADSTLKGQQVHDALCYINKYAFQNAFKAIVANKRKTGREILSLATLFTYKDKSRFFALMLFSSIPNIITYRLWALGKGLKSITRKSVNRLGTL